MNMRPVDRMLRAVARDILDRRDRLSGWKPHRKAFLASMRKDRESLARDAEDRLRRILYHAYETSPYYRDAWNAIGFRPSSSFTSKDLQQLPFLTKDIVREHKSTLVSERFRSDELDLSYTGGTTGTQTSFYLDHACAINRVGRQWGMLDLCGYRPGTRRALVWGVSDDLAQPGTRINLKRWFREYASSQEVLCCSVMNEEMLMDYHGRLLRFRPEVLYGYPYAITHLGRFIQEQGLEPIKVKTIVSTAERLTEVQRGFLQKVFGGEVFNFYCTREYGCIGFECRRHVGFHIDSESVFVEIIRDGRRADPGEPGEITITDLQNYGMPFIRSRTADFGSLSPQPCECGSPLPVLNGLDGRATDCIWRPDGSMVAGGTLADVFGDISSIRFSQFVQEKLNELDVFLVVTSGFSNETEKEAIRQVRELVGPEMAVNIRRVPEIARNPRSGKYQEVICKVNQPQRSTSTQRRV
ncbi:MAG: hypothetical protein DMD63_02655 [Gemmatimonadetes bacterium]|nr:MAG: hypothetical protein DMD63_02655 [Gemmatimonadota bacterium]